MSAGGRVAVNAGGGHVHVADVVMEPPKRCGGFPDQWGRVRVTVGQARTSECATPLGWVVLVGRGRVMVYGTSS